MYFLSLFEWIEIAHIIYCQSNIEAVVQYTYYKDKFHQVSSD